jgi:subtilisin family serine protease
VPKNRFTEFNLDPALAETAESAPDQQVIEGIIRLEDPAQIPEEFHVVCQFTRVCTGRFLSEHTWTIRQHPNVVSLKAARPLGMFQNDNSARLAKSEGAIWRAGRPLPFTGRGCIVAALDFGLDFGHPNFLNPDGTTRVVSFWHQGATYDPRHPNRYGYGRVFSPDDINGALQASDPYEALGYHPSISDTGNGSHGTHTLDIAAGNGRAPGSVSGIAPEAALIFVHLSTPRLGIVGDLGDSVRMLEALDFVRSTAGDHPWVVNISVGREAGSHDATSPFEQAMHELLRMGHGTNRAICQSAGNYGSADLAVNGWLRDGEHRDLEWIVHPSDIGPEIDAWYSGNDRFVVVLLPPDGGNPVEVKLGEVGDIRHNGVLIGRVYHRKNDPNNRDNHVEVFLYRGAPAGVWILRLIGDYVITGRFHAWIERAVPGAQSRFDRKITSRKYTLGTIATSPLVITVGAYDANAEGHPLAPFSSCGPTRDERQDKPELLAPGVGVVAARSIPRDAARQEGLLIPRSGTSMATPHVTGLVATLFEAAGHPVSISEIRDCLEQSAEPMTDAEHPNCCAWGRLNVAEAIRRIRDLTSDPTRHPQPAASHTRSMVPEYVAFGAADSTLQEEISVEEEQIDASDNAVVALPPDQRVLVDSDPTSRFLEKAEQAVLSSYGGRCESEISYLQKLLHELENNISVGRFSPAALLREALRNGPLLNKMSNGLEIIATPSQRPKEALYPGDLMLRAVPGSGDVGHVSVLASRELLAPSALAAHGINAESQQAGYYGLVVEAGAFPHTQSRRFARRLLDSRGRVPPNTVFLRPRFLRLRAITDFRFGDAGADAGLSVEGQNPYLPECCDSKQISVTAIGDETERLPHTSLPSESTHASGPLAIDPSNNDVNNDIVLVIVTIQKPGDVGQYWADEVQPNRSHWAHSLSELERDYINAMTDPTVPAPLRMRIPVDPNQMASDDTDNARRLFGTGPDAARRYANYENRRRILANYVYTHPATLRLELGLYRSVRDINPLHFALERGWQIGSGREMFTEQEVSRLGAAFEFVASLALVYGVGKALDITAPVAGEARALRSLEDPIYDLPVSGGIRINDRWYTEHALERIAPDTPQVRAQIRARMAQRIERLGINSSNPAYNRILARALQRIDPRGVPPSVVEAEILRPGSTSVRVITARGGKIVVSVIPRPLPDSDTGLAEDLGEQALPNRIRTVFYDRDSLQYLDGWTRATGPPAVFLIDRSSYDPVRAAGIKRGRAFDLYLKEALRTAGQRDRMDLPAPMFFDHTLATVPLNTASRGDWDDQMIAQLIGAGHRLTIQSETDQWRLIKALFAKAEADARNAAQERRAAREFVAYMLLDIIKATLVLVEAANVTMENRHAKIPLGVFHERPDEPRRFVPGGDYGTRVIGNIHTHYLLDPLIDLNSTSITTTTRSIQTSLHSGVSDVDVDSARGDHIVVYAVDSNYLHRANPNGTKNDKLARSGDVLREALRVFGGEPGLSSSG